MLLILENDPFFNDFEVKIHKSEQIQTIKLNYKATAKVEIYTFVKD